MFKLIPLFLLLTISTFVAGMPTSNNTSNHKGTWVRISDNGHLDCNSLYITANAGNGKSWKIVSFALFSDEGEDISEKLHWSVSNAQIISGQGTAEITTKATNKVKSNEITASVEISQDNKRVCLVRSKPVVVNKGIIWETSTNVTGVKLSSKQLVVGCLPEHSAQSSSMIIDVATKAIDPENDPIKFVYVVSGGRIIGTGPNVQWDLSGVQPGTYKITAGVDDGCGLCGRTVTKVVEVIGCSLVIWDDL